jgi:CheY-like chemotaxis protein
VTKGMVVDRRDLLGRTLYDITQLLESADRADERVWRVLVLMRSLVPYQQCALLEAQVGHDPHVVAVPEARGDEGILLTAMLVDLFGHLVDAKPRAGAPAVRRPGFHLAVPLVGLDEVIGLLLVRSAAGEYTDEHVRALSLVAAKLAAYFTTLRARDELAEVARERDEALRIAEASNRKKDELLALVAHQLRTPLTSMLAWANILGSKTDDNAGRARAIEELERGVQAQARLVDDILDLACGASAETLRTLEPLARLEPTVEGRRLGGRGLLEGLHVVLVDHDLGLRESLRAVLETCGADVTAVATASEALAALARSRPDVLLFGDLAIPGEVVYDLVREVTAGAAPLPVASFSAWRLQERERALAAGFRLHLPQPIEIEALVSAVAGLAGRLPGAA